MNALLLAIRTMLVAIFNAATFVYFSLFISYIEAFVITQNIVGIIEQIPPFVGYCVALRMIYTGKRLSLAYI